MHIYWNQGKAGANAYAVYPPDYSDPVNVSMVINSQRPGSAEKTVQ